MRTLKRSLLNFGLTTSAVAVLVMGVYTIGPWLETKFLPVYSRFEIMQIEPYGEGQTRAIFKFTKYRQCEPQGFAWYTGELGAAFRQLRVKVESTGSVPSRPLGVQMTSPYVIDATPAQVKDATFAEIFSTCHPFWTTRSVIYP